MISKIVNDLQAALAGVKDGSTVLLGGFGGAGQAHELLDALIEQGATDLTIVSNNAGSGTTGIAALLAAGKRLARDIPEDVAVFQIEPGGVVRVVDDVSGAGPEELKRLTGLELVF
eukprot:gene627-629_t